MSQEKRHQLQALDFARHEHSLSALNQREKRSLEVSLVRESRKSEREEREGESRGSAKAELNLAAQQRLGSVFEQASGETALPGIALSKEFAKVAREQREEGKQGSSKGPKKKANSAEDKPKRRRRRRRRRDRDIDRGR